MDMDYEGSRFSLLDSERKIVINAEYKIVLVAMPGGILRRGHAFERYLPSQVLGPLGADDPIDVPGNLKDGLAIAEKLAARAGADVLYPDALGPMYIALFNVQALADCGPRAARGRGDSGPPAGGPCRGRSSDARVR